MKKISKYTVIALTGLLMASCGSDDFTDWADPQTNPQEEAITIPGVTASAASAIDFSKSADLDSVPTFSLSTAALPEGFELANARIEIAPDVEGATTTTLGASLNGNTPSADLVSMLESAYGKRPVARDFNAHVYLNAVKDGQAVLIDAGTVKVTMTPNAPFIASAYYLLGDMTGSGKWAIGDVVKFSHSADDVYTDPVFTVMITTTKDNSYWKIIPQNNIDLGNPWAVQNDPKGVVGVETDGDDSMSGTLITSTSEGKNPNAAKIAKAGIYQITINMMDYTYTVKEIAPKYYIVGAMQGWNSSRDKGMTCMLYAQSTMVQSYTTKFEGAGNLKIWLGDDFGNWDSAYGTAVDGDTSASGVIGGSGAISCPEPGSYYTFTVDFSSMTYTWTKLANQSPATYASIGLVGDFNGWGSSEDIAMTEVTPHNWYVKTAIPSSGGLKFRADSSWTSNWGTGIDVSDQYYGTGVSGGDNITVPAGTYSVYFNDITGELAFVAE